MIEPHDAGRRSQRVAERVSEITRVTPDLRANVGDHVTDIQLDVPAARLTRARS